MSISKERLTENLARLDELLGIDKTDYNPMSEEEARARIEERMDEQDNVIYPKRVKEGRVTPEWRKYIIRRGLAVAEKE